MTSIVRVLVLPALGAALAAAQPANEMMALSRIPSGVNYYVQSPSPMWYGEGDEMVFIDGETMPSIVGTGTTNPWANISY